MPDPTASASAGRLRDEVAAHYDDLDRYYREIWGEHVHHGLWTSAPMTPADAARRLIDAVVEQAGIGAGAAVCDVGCGYGGTARVLARDHGARVTALTISAAQHAYARAVDPDEDNPAYLLRDWMENGLDAEAYDAVLAIESSEHMPDLAAFYSEAARVLRPGGRLVVCAWLTGPRPRGWERRWLIGPICREGRLRGMESMDEHLRQSRAAGFVPVASVDVSRQVKRTWPICARRVAAGLLRDPTYRHFLLRGGSPNRIFALTLARIWLAYELGSMRYGILTAAKPGAGAGASAPAARPGC
jgi:tocopherol O-methyltransferase